MRITLIEDSPETFKKLVETLSAKKLIFEIQFINTAPFFDSAIEDRIEAFKPDLIVLDLLLVDNAESGFRVLRLLKASKRLKDAPVVVCSKYIDGETDFGRKCRARALQFGAAEALTKIPFPPAETFLLYDHSVAPSATNVSK